MKRRIIKINEELCNGCGICAGACHEGAIGMVDGKAKLLREDYCDGLGDCLPACPVNAISFEEREAAAYDEAAVKQAMAEKGAPSCNYVGSAATTASRLMQWPAQIKLVPPKAPFFDGANLLIAADCTAYAYANFHNDFMKNRVTLIGCPKLDAVDYSAKLAQIFSVNDIKNVVLARMQVPCCGGMEYAVKNAIQLSGKDIPLQVATISIKGQILK